MLAVAFIPTHWLKVHFCVNSNVGSSYKTQNIMLHPFIAHLISVRATLTVSPLSITPIEIIDQVVYTHVKSQYN